jgi:hypothetical protein
MDPDSFLIEGGEIDDATITTSAEELGIADGNVATITFTPKTTLDADSGAIKITVPEWGMIYDDELAMSKTIYPIGDSDFSCSSDAFTSIDISESENEKLYIKYTESLTSDVKVTITCTNWRNPTLPEVISGFSILTYD